MKFAKILFIFGAFALIGLTLTIERSVRSEAQYQEMTKTLRVEVGYKDLLTPPDEKFNEKVLERDYKGIVTYKNKKTEDFVLQASMLKEGAFRSGIPFFTKNPDKFSTPGFSQIFIAIPGHEKVQYVPFVQLTQACLFDVAILPLKMTCPVKTSVGAGMIGFVFSDVMDTEALTIVNQINKLKTFRISEINRTIVGVLDAINRLKAKQEELKAASANVADVYKKQSDKQKIIIQLIRKQGEIDDQITSEAEKYKGLTANVEKASKKLAEITHNIRTAEIERAALENGLKNLQNKMITAEQISKMKADLEKYLQLAKYWIQGAIFHRIINENEAKTLEDMVVKDKLQDFNNKIDDYFFPQ